MNKIRLLSLSILTCAAGVFFYIQQTAPDPLARKCLAAQDEAMTICMQAYASDNLTDQERGQVALNLGYMNDVNGDWDAAVAHYRDTIRFTPQKASAHYNLGLILRDRKDDPEAAIVAFSSYLASDEDDVEALAQRARTYREIDAFALAEADLDLATTIEPENPVILRQRAELLQDQGDDDAALILLDQAIELHPDMMGFWRERSWVKRQMGDYDGALADIGHVIGTEPGPMWPWYQRGWLNARLGNYQQALTDLQTASAKDPSYKPAHREMRRLLPAAQTALRGQPARLSAFADAGLINEPDNMDLVYLRAVGQTGEGKNIGAINDINRVIAATPYPQTMIFFRSSIHAAAGQFDLALADLEQLTESPTLHNTAIQQMGEQAKKLYDAGRDAEAEALDSDAGDLAVLYATALQARIDLHRARNDWARALEAIDLMVAYDADDRRHWITRGDALEQLNRFDEALDSYSAAIRLVDTGFRDHGSREAIRANALLRRGALYQSQRQSEKALADFDDALASGDETLISAFQQKMSDADHYAGPINGTYDIATQAALRACAANPSC